MKINKKILLSLGSTAMVIAPLAAVISCGSKTSGSTTGGSKTSNSIATKWQLSSRRNIKTAMPQTKGVQPYAGRDTMYAPTQMGGGNAAFAESLNSYSTSGFTVFVKGNPKYDFEGKLVSGKKSKSYLKFSMYDKVTVVKADGSKVVFDSDSIDPADAKSINGTNFKSVINAKATIKGLTFHLRTDAKWVKNSSGEESNKKVTLDDYVAGINYSKLSNSTTRYGGKKAKISVRALDTYTNNKTNTTLAVPKAQMSRSLWDGYYRTTYGMKLHKDVNNFVDKATNEVNIEFVASTETRQAVALWNEIFKMYGGFVPFLANDEFATQTNVPDEMATAVFDAINKAKKSNDPNLTTEEKAVTTKADAIELIKKIPAFSEGFYKYQTQKWDEFKTAGQYYLKSVTNKDVIFEQNTHYIDKSWVADKSTIQSIDYSMINSSGDYKATNFLGYQQGIYVSSPYVGLDVATQNKIDEDLDGYGVEFIKGRSARSQIGGRWTRFNYLPIPTTDAAKKNFFFNDGFSKVMYGVDLNTLTGSNGKALRDGDIISHTLTGTGAEFRTSLYAAINWYSAINDNSKGQEWTSRLAPEQTFDGEKDAIDVEDVYSSYGLGLNDANDFSDTQITHAERVEKATDINADNDRFLSSNKPDMDALKANIKDAIDKADLAQGEKVIFELPIDYSNYTPKIRASLEGVRKAIESLDDRIVVEAAMEPIDGTSSDSSVTGGKVYPESSYRRSYLPDKKWTLKGVAPASADDLFSGYIKPRLLSSAGTSPFNLNSALSSFPADTLTQIFDNFGYLQDGVFNAIALYSQDKNSAHLPGGMKKFGTFAKTFSDALNKGFGDVTATEIANLLDDSINLPATNVDVVEAANAVKSFTMKGTIGSNPENIAKFDYFGLKGSPTWEAWTTKVNASEATDNQKKIKNVISDMFGNIFKSATFDMRLVLDKYSVADKISTITAFDTLIGNSFTFWSLALGNRSEPHKVMIKSWLHENADEIHRSFLASYSVDV